MNLYIELPSSEDIKILQSRIDQLLRILSDPRTDKDYIPNFKRLLYNAQSRKDLLSRSFLDQ